MVTVDGAAPTKAAGHAGAGVPAAGHAAAGPTGGAAAGAAGLADGIGRVVARMRALRDGLPPGDGVAVFNRVYLSVTEEVERRLRAGGFAGPAAAAELDVRFAARYLSAVEAGGSPPACWRPLIHARHHRGLHPLQFAMAGINAHIGHDLALAVVATCRALDVGPEALEEDFHRVGGVLDHLEERIREDLMPGPDLLERAEPFTHLIGCWSLERARDAAWAAARALWLLRGLPDACEEFERRLDKGTGLVSRFLLTPLNRP
jgi:Family of unknown function (DUF5995)